MFLSVQIVELLVKSDKWKFDETKGDILSALQYAIKHKKKMVPLLLSFGAPVTAEGI